MIPPMNRREFVTTLAALPILQLQPVPAREARPFGTGPIPYWLFELDDALIHCEYDEAMAAARHMIAAIEDEGIPAPWRPAYRILTNHLSKDFMVSKPERASTFRGGASSRGGYRFST
jgi:hypothetical protein